GGRRGRAVMKVGVLAGGVLTLLAAGAAWWWFTRTSTPGALVLAGNVEVRQVNLGFKVAGRIQQLKVDEGDAVTEAQSLATLEKVYFEDTIAQLTAQRDQAKANLAKLEAGNRPEEIAQAEANMHEREATAANPQKALQRSA